ncbi:MAG: germination protein YpeB [Clostridia bacterium]|nr:germination protein YpeB [Clostridia bacterium]
MKKKQQEIGVNLSSGAEKVERIEKEKKTLGNTRVEQVKKRTTEKVSEPISAKGDAAMGDSVRTEKEVKALKKAEKESAAATARVEAALKKKEEKERKAQEKKEREERLRKEREEAQRARAHAKANRRRERDQARAKKGNGQDRKSYGGWLAAVISLSAVSLALATTVTIGAMEMKTVKEETMSSYKATMYELTGIMEHVDDDLDRVRISESPAQQSRILTDLLVQARLAEMDLERLPIEAETDRNTTVFINRTAKLCERLLGKLRKGEKLTEEDKQNLERLYVANHQIRQQLGEYLSTMQDKDITSYIKDGVGGFADMLHKLEEVTLEENRAALQDKKMEMDGAGMQRMPKTDGAGMDTAQAESKCQTYFADYNIAEFRCVGETVMKGGKAYNVQGYDADGTMLFAQIDAANGALVRFDFYEDCNSETFDKENAQTIAENFLQKLGYSNMQAVRVRENGTTEDITFVYEKDGVVYYPDEVRVKVCRSRGIVSGMDASRFMKNHRGRVEPNVKITLQQAREKLSEKLTVEHSRLAVIEVGKKEQAAYEFYGSYGEEKYLVYLSAQTGEEIAILNVNGLQA